MTASHSSLRWCETVGWLKPTGSVRSHTHASWPAWAATSEISRSRARADTPFAPAASRSASPGLMTWRTPGAQQSVSTGKVVRSDVTSCAVGISPAWHILTNIDACLDSYRQASMRERTDDVRDDDRAAARAGARTICGGRHNRQLCP